MIKMQKNPKASEEVQEYVKTQKKSLEVLLEVEAHQNAIGMILYKHMPKMVRWTMKEDRFLEFFKNNKSLLMSQLLGNTGGKAAK